MSDSGVTIRFANKDDMVSVASMIQELANEQKLPNASNVNVKALQEHGFESTPPAFRCLVAEFPNREQDRAVGFALYYPTYSMLEGRTMMIQGLYVTPDERRRGVGDKLFNAVAKEATSLGCCRLEFHVLQWNRARSFYERKGAVNMTSAEQWCFYRLAGDALRNAAGAP